MAKDDEVKPKTITLWGIEIPIGLVIVAAVFIFASGNGADLIKFVTSGAFTAESEAELFTPEQLDKEVVRRNQETYINEAVELHGEQIEGIAIVQRQQGRQIADVQFEVTETREEVADIKEVVDDIAETVGANGDHR